jgi:hypothetical protein
MAKRKPSAWNKEVKSYTDKGMPFPKALKAASAARNKAKKK